jgi:long-subunit fatty acid transport protein
MKIPAVFILVFSIASAAAAQDQQLGARTKGMGGSYTAFEDDPVSIWLNPAGISKQPAQVAIAYQTYTTYPLHQTPSGSNVSTSAGATSTFADPAFVPSYLGLVVQIGDGDAPMAIGICYAQPYHLNYSFDKVSDPAQTTFVPDTNVEQSFSRFRAAIARDFKFSSPEERAYLTHLSVGIGVDVGYERWSFTSTTQPSASGNATAPGFGGGLLLGVYDNGENLKFNLGVAYQSAVRWHFNVDPTIEPAFDMPQQLNAGVTGYLLPQQPLRVTVDMQWVEWSKTAEDPTFIGQPHFRNAINYSAGLEYRIPLTTKVSLYPRVGYRRFEAPWANKNDLPETSDFKLVLDTKGGQFNIVTAGLGFSYTDDKGKLWNVDLGVDAGGDAFNFALGFTLEL